MCCVYLRYKYVLETLQVVQIFWLILLGYNEVIYRSHNHELLNSVS